MWGILLELYNKKAREVRREKERRRNINIAINRERISKRERKGKRVGGCLKGIY